MFVGRQAEIKLIKDIANGTGNSLLLYGKRKVGKTTLLNKALENCSGITVYYECVKSSLEDNIKNFVERLVREKVLSVKLNFGSLQDVFAYLNTLPSKFNVVIDEYPYLKKFEQPDKVDSIFQNIIDNHLGNINLFISGSHVGMMKDLLEEKDALYGRFNTVIKLKELNYLEASDFYSNKETYDKIAFYSVFGGSPFVNGCIDKEKSLKDNIINTILNPTSAVSNYAENLLMSDLSGSINAERVLFAISNGKKRHKDIEAKLGYEKNGLLSKHLKTLMEMELVSKVYPINAVDDSKKAYYEVSDNLLRFYYAYIYHNKSSLQVLGADSFYDEYIAPSIITYISHRFEEICRIYFSLQINNKVKTGILNVGTYYYDDSVNKKNGEFDVALKRRNGYEIYEAKYYSNSLKENEMVKEIEQIKNINGLNVTKIGFVTISGVEKRIDGIDYIDGDELYSVN